MYQNKEKQERYWNRDIWNFDSIYTHKKKRFLNYLDNKFRWEVYARYDYTIKNSQPIEGKSVLDIGCGTGKFALEYARQKAKEVIGIDIAANMINLCKQRAKEENLDSICTFLKTDPFDFKTDKIFDICIGMGLFDYITDPIPVIKRMKELTSDRIILSFPKKGTLRALIRKIRLGIRGCDVHFYYKDEFIKLMEQAGLKVHSIVQFNQLYCVLAYIK